MQASHGITRQSRSYVLPFARWLNCISRSAVRPHLPQVHPDFAHLKLVAEEKPAITPLIAARCERARGRAINVREICARALQINGQASFVFYLHKTDCIIVEIWLRHLVGQLTNSPSIYFNVTSNVMATSTEIFCFVPM